MPKNTRTDDYYTKLARKEGYQARSVYKLQQIDEKYQLLDQTVQTALDIGCAPGSWLQYLSRKLTSNQQRGAADVQIIGLDLKEVTQPLPGVTTYQQDAADRAGVQQILDEHGIEQFDLIVSDMAADTIGKADIDALRTISLIEKTLRIYDAYLKEGGKFAIKVFMGPGYQELVRDAKELRGAKHIVTFKPPACRKQSKEIYLVKRS